MFGPRSQNSLQEALWPAAGERSRQAETPSGLFYTLTTPFFTLEQWLLAELLDFHRVNDEFKPLRQSECIVTNGQTQFPLEGSHKGGGCCTTLIKHKQHTSRPVVTACSVVSVFAAGDAAVVTDTAAVSMQQGLPQDLHQAEHVPERVIERHRSDAHDARGARVSVPKVTLQNRRRSMW